MGCTDSKVKQNIKIKQTLNKIKNNDELNVDESLLDHYTKEERINILSNSKKIQHLHHICEFEENVELLNLTFLDSSFYSFFQKIGINKKMKSIFLKNIEFEG